MSFTSDLLSYIAEFCDLPTALKIMYSKRILYRRAQSRVFWGDKAKTMGFQLSSMDFPPLIAFAKDYAKWNKATGLPKLELAKQTDPEILDLEARINELRMIIDTLKDKKRLLVYNYDLDIHKIHELSLRYASTPKWIHDAQRKFRSYCRELIVEIDSSKSTLDYMDDKFPLYTTMLIPKDSVFWMKRQGTRLIFIKVGDKERTVYKCGSMVAMTPERGLLPPFFKHYLTRCGAKPRELELAFSLPFECKYDRHRKSYKHPEQGSESYINSGILPNI